MICPNCEVDIDYDVIHKVLYKENEFCCPHCNTSIEIEYEPYNDPEDGDIDLLHLHVKKQS